VWLRPLLVLLLLVYVYAVYSGMVLYLAGSLFPPIYMRSLIWCDMMAAALTALALVMEVNQVGPSGVVPTDTQRFSSKMRITPPCQAE
jgi:hypothetical protein